MNKARVRFIYKKLRVSPEKRLLVATFAEIQHKELIKTIDNLV
jgi:phage regulator Rha-like protein